MKERLLDKLKRKFREWRIRQLNRVIQKAVEKKDDLSYQTFMIYTWARDEVTDYHLIAERSYPDHRVYGMDTIWYKEKKDGTDGNPDVNQA